MRSSGGRVKNGQRSAEAGPRGIGHRQVSGVSSLQSHSKTCARSNRLPDEREGLEEVPILLRELEALPDVVGRHLAFAGVQKDVVPTVVRTKRKGEIRLREDQPWASFLAAVRYTIDPPSLVREARVKASSLVSLRSHDELVDGVAREQVWPVRRWKSVDSRGPEANQDAIVRFMSEMAWFPAAYRMPYVQWDEIDDRSAEMTVTIGETLAHAVLTFGADASLVRFEGDRFRRLKRRKWALWTWTMDYGPTVTLAGLELPGSATATWSHHAREFPYVRITIEDLSYD